MARSTSTTPLRPNKPETRAPRSSPYARGRAFEYRVRDHLRKLGYYAQRSPASKTPIDITGIAPGRVLFVQCKRHGVCSPREWNALYDVAISCGARPVLAAMPGKRGISYHLMTDRKDGSRRAQPMMPFDPALTGEVT